MTTLTEQITGAAEFHAATLATWWEKLPTDARAEIASYLADLIDRVEKLQKLLPPGLNPTDVAPAATQLYGLIKGFEEGRAIVVAAVSRQIPELAPVAAALNTP